MSRRWRDRLQATLAPEGARMRLVRRRLHRHAVVCEVYAPCDPPTCDLAVAADVLDRALDGVAEQVGIAGLACDVTLGDAWMLYDVIEAELDDMPRRAAEALVRAALADTAGVAPDELVVRWRRQSGRGFACAVAASTVQTVQAVLQRHAVRVGRITGDFLLAYEAKRNALGRGRAILAVPRGTGTQLALIADGDVAATRYQPGAGDADALTSASRALLHSCGNDPDDGTRFFIDDHAPAESEGAQWTRAVTPPSWQVRARSHLAPPAVDLSPARPHVRATSWILLAAGTLATTVAAVQFQTASGQHLHEARALRAAEASLDAARPGRRGGARPAEGEQGRAASAVVRELQVPWARLFAAFETVAREDVALLSVEPSAAKQEVRIVAEAKSSDAMIDFLDALRTQPLKRVVLVSHQVQSQAPGTPLRFQARATWEAR